MAGLPDHCPNCGEELEFFNDQRDVALCLGCGHKIMLLAEKPPSPKAPLPPEEPRFASPVSNLKPISFDAPMYPPSDDAEGAKPKDAKTRALLADAEKQAELYFKQGADGVRYRSGLVSKSGYEAVLKYFGEAKNEDPKNSRLYVSASRFFARANLEAFKNKSRKLKNKAKFIATYTSLMDSAVSFAQGDYEKRAYQNEKQQTLAMLEAELAKLNAPQGGESDGGDELDF